MTPPNSAITVRIVGMTDVGLVREHNEDNFLVVDLNSGETDFAEGRDIAIGARGALLVVCDGMGGAAAGEVASKMAVDAMLREMAPSNDGPLDVSSPSLEIKLEHSLPGTTEITPQVKPEVELGDKQSPTPESSAGQAAGPADAQPQQETASAPKSTDSAHAEPAATRLTPRTIDDLLGSLEVSAAASATPRAPASAAHPEPLDQAPPSTEKLPSASTPEASAGATGLDEKQVQPSSTLPLGTTEDAQKSPDAPVEVAPVIAIHEAELHGLARKLRAATNRANQEIYEAACADIAKAGMGTTLTGLLLVRSHVIVAQVGDSRAYMWRKGKLTQITHDQSLVNQLLDSGQITPEQAKLFEHSNVILQALGVQEDVEVVLSTEVVRREDRLLLCSDGLVGVVPDEEIQEVITSSEKIEEAARRLIDLARAGGGPDNITVILAEIKGQGVPAAAITDEVHYRPLYLDGEKPPERRVWAPEYGFIGPPIGGRELPVTGIQPASASSRVSVMAMSAVLAFLCIGIVAAMLYHRQPPVTVPPPVAIPPGNSWATPPVPPPAAARPLPTQAPGPEDLGTDTSDARDAAPAGVAPKPPAPSQEQPESPAPALANSAAPPEESNLNLGKNAKPHKAHKRRNERSGGEEPLAATPDGGATGALDNRAVMLNKPAAVSEQPAGPSEKPAGPSEKPAGPSEKPAGPSEKPAGPSEKPAGPSEKPAAASDKPAAAPDKPAAAPDKPAAAPDKPAAAPDKPAAAPDKPAAAPDKPVATPDKPASAAEPANPQ